jgi:hypothetical protein
MQRKLFVLFASLVLLSLMIAPVGMANAQGPTPLPTPRLSQPPQPPSNPPLELEGAGGRLTPLLPANPGVNPSSITVGSPGVSFRYLQTFGVTGQPYLADGSHLNGPNGLFIDASNSLYVAEEKGDRALKYNSSGVNTLILGHAGQPWAQDDFLGGVKDVAVRSGDGHIFVLLSPALKEFDVSGTLIQAFPPANPGETGSDNGHFAGDPGGLAFGPGGYLYVSDTGNHRIQVLDVSGAATSYIATIGTAGTPQSNNTGFNQPAQIAFDSLGRLYVVDTGNWRVQRCSSSNPWTTWTCSTFFGATGVQGTDLSHLWRAYGIGISSTDAIFIVDSATNRVLKCNASASCSLFAGVTGVPGADNSHFAWPADAAVDSGGNVFVSDYDNHRVQKFNGDGVYQSTIGVTLVPYLTDSNHFNEPYDIALAPDNSMYILESTGYRLIKLNASGVFQWSVGQAGIYGRDNAHLGGRWGGVDGSLAVDASGRVYVGDSGNARVQIFNSDGSYYATLGSYGSGNGEFQCLIGISISPVNGDIYVTDRCDHRIQVFTSSLVYKATLGVTGTPGNDNLHFNSPRGVTVDNSGNIYVADSDNQRVQKCQLVGGAPGYACSTFAGVSEGVSGNDFGHLGHPLSVKVDASGRVYVADEWNNRIQVFDSSGAYLTTIGGSWGPNTGQMSGPSGITVDSAGNVYVTDRENHRIQKFAPGVPGWRQSNINGFGDLANAWIVSLSNYDGQMYAGTQNGNGAQVWRTSDGKTWSQFSPGWALDNNLVYASQQFGSYLYVGTYNDKGGEIWRSNGTTWEQVVSGGFGGANNFGVNAFAVFSNTIYAATSANNGVLQIYRSASGNAGSWTPVVNDGFGGAGVSQDVTMDVYGGYLYVGIGRGIVAELWRTNDGTIWSPVFTNGLSANNTSVSAMAEFGGAFYIGLRNVTTGGEVWRTTNGTTFTPVFDHGLSDSDNGRPYGLDVLNGHLYLVFSNLVTGAEVWRTSDGTNWQQVGDAGWGDSNNAYADYFDKGATVFNNSLFIGTSNSANGGEVWQMVNQIYLPLIMR